MNEYGTTDPLWALVQGAGCALPGEWTSTPTEHAAQVPLVGRDLEKSLLFLLKPYVRHKRRGLAVLYPGLVRYGSGHMADSSWHNPGLTESYDFWDATGYCLAWWSKGREARVCLTM